ncbi:PREDICTED: peroxiredoxin-2A-like [Camelina sativa]|uniref:Peroxiredoxin-2A-like n=1 Tax=Camelina sativa TaxID=90675 RepID=A0ABM0WED9_CAMSA|nr:PREDICTED: peroxiredoxin-2A-like [Camelina sativa]
MTTTTAMSNLPNDLVEDIVFRVPWKYMRAVRLTCKNWNTLFESQSFTKMHIDKEKAAAKELGETRKVVLMDYNVYLMGITVNENPSIQCLGKLTCQDKQVKIYKVFHCEGLLLCILKEDDTKIVVCNPYLGQTRWIQTISFYRPTEWKGRDFFKYALGYENYSENISFRRPKILRFIDNYSRCVNLKDAVIRYEIYSFDTDLWTTLDVTPRWRIESHCGISLKGDTYWVAAERNAFGKLDHIICFDFTRERFGPLLPLPFQAWRKLFASLSLVREENIAALFQTFGCKIEIWITTKIDDESVLWSHFFTTNMPYLDMTLSFNTFFVDEEKEVAVVFDKERNGTQNTVNIMGETGCLTKLELGEPMNKNSLPRVCSYVPSLVQIKQHKGGKRTEVKKKKGGKRRKWSH